MRGYAAAIIAISSFSLTACYQLPVSGPGDNAIFRNAASASLVDPDYPIFDYVLVDLSASVVANAVDIDPGSFFRSYGGGKGVSALVPVGPGDILQLTVFESKSGGLFIPSDAGVRPGNYVQLPPQIVDHDGTVSVPYAGQIRAQGRSLQSIEREIEHKLSNRAIEPKVVVSLVEQHATLVSVVGEVNQPRKAPITQAGERVLDMIALAGGIKYPGYETYVTLQRGSRKATVYFDSLVKNPDENIYARPGDVIYIYREPRRFIAFGAVGSGVSGIGASQQFNFDQESVSLAEGVAKAGGLIDDRANPGTVFLYRAEPRRILEAMSVDLSKFPPGQKAIPTIYRANFRNPASYFAAQQFPMRSSDIIYVTNAEAIEVTKFLTYVTTISSSVATVTANAALTREAATFVGNGKVTPNY